MGRGFDALTMGPARRSRRMRRRLEALDRSDAKLRAAGLDPLEEWHRSRDQRMGAAPATVSNANWPLRLARMCLVAMAIAGVVYILTHRMQPGDVTGRSSGTGRPPNFPPASSEERKHPLGAPAVAPAGTGGYLFEHTQPGSSSPVTWDPCRPIHYVVNGNAPAGQEAVVSSVATEVSRLTGLQFVYDGRTTELAGDGHRPLYQPSRYGRRWAPVLVSWTDPARVPELSGGVIGLGGGASVGLKGGPQTYVSGIVYLDTPQFRAEAATLGTQQRGILRAIVLHEFGHLLGLAHVSDPGAIMYPEAHLTVTDYASGDLRGLHALATGHCASDL